MLLNSRHSLGHNPNSNTAIQDGLAVCNLQLESAAKRIKSYRSKFSSEVCEEWTNRLIDLSKETATVTFEISVTHEEIDKIIALRQKNSELDAENDDYKKVASNVRKAVNKRSKDYDTEDSNIIKKIMGILVENEEEDADLRVVDEVETEHDFKCPYTTMIMQIPMKNTNCNHRIDKASLEALLTKAKTAKCPVAGCQQQWTKASASEDKMLALRMERFFRVTAVPGSDRGRPEATEILDGDD
eukprot:gene4969-9941_t